MSVIETMANFSAGKIPNLIFETHENHDSLVDPHCVFFPLLCVYRVQFRMHVAKYLESRSLFVWVKKETRPCSSITTISWCWQLLRLREMPFIGIYLLGCSLTFGWPLKDPLAPLQNVIGVTWRSEFSPNQALKRRMKGNQGEENCWFRIHKLYEFKYPPSWRARARRESRSRLGWEDFSIDCIRADKDLQKQQDLSRKILKIPDGYWE